MYVERRRACESIQSVSAEVPYDALDDAEQRARRDAWNARIAERIAALDFEASLKQAGVPWAEADEAGRLVVRSPDA
jgi:hypothetical protein